MIDHLIRNDYKIVDKRDQISTLFGYLRGEVADVPIVFDGKLPYGVINERGLARSHVAGEQKIDRFVIGTKRLPPNATIDEALDVVVTSRVLHVPVANGNKLVGYVTAVDLLKSLSVGPRADALVAEAPVLKESDAMGEAMHAFNQASVDVLPIVDAQGRLSGVIRRHDLVGLRTDARPQGRKPANGQLIDPKDDSVVGFMDRVAPTLPLTAPFPDVRDALAEHGFVVLVDGARAPRGVVTPESAAAGVRRGA